MAWHRHNPSLLVLGRNALCPIPLPAKNARSPASTPFRRPSIDPNALCMAALIFYWFKRRALIRVRRPPLVWAFHWFKLRALVRVAPSMPEWFSIGSNAAFCSDTRRLAHAGFFRLSPVRANLPLSSPGKFSLSAIRQFLQGMGASDCSNAPCCAYGRSCPPAAFWGFTVRQCPPAAWGARPVGWARYSPPSPLCADVRLWLFAKGLR